MPPLNLFFFSFLILKLKLKFSNYTSYTHYRSYLFCVECRVTSARKKRFLHLLYVVEQLLFLIGRKVCDFLIGRLGVVVIHRTYVLVMSVEAHSWIVRSPVAHTEWDCSHITGSPASFFRLPFQKLSFHRTLLSLAWLKVHKQCEEYGLGIFLIFFGGGSRIG